jgi:hypothetical protein
MTHTLAPIEVRLGIGSRRPARRIRSPLWAAAALTAAAALFASPLLAAPLSLDSPGEVAAFVERLDAYSAASRVRWVIAARTIDDARAKIVEIGKRLPSFNNYLVARLIPQATGEAGSAGPGSVRAWVQPQFGSDNGAPACSWQVWVTDPALPSSGTDPVAVPLAPHDRLPVSPAATFRVGHTGLLQSKLYAFDETRPGAIRDLATADVNVPVPRDGGDDTIFLAMARLTTPFLESLKASLADSNGERRDLGSQYALRDKLFGASRGIGGNIQAIPPQMIAPRAFKAAQEEMRNLPEDLSALTETCTYVLVPTR